MDLEELRCMVRKSLREHLKEVRRGLRSAPKNLSDFRMQLIVAFAATSQHGLSEWVENETLDGGHVFNEVYSTYDNIMTELDGAPTINRDAEYKNIAPSYIHDLVVDLVGLHGVGNRDVDVTEVATKVTAAMVPMSSRRR